jgi:hypothetical protein
MADVHMIQGKHQCADRRSSAPLPARSRARRRLLAGTIASSGSASMAGVGLLPERNKETENDETYVCYQGLCQD